MGRKKSSPLPKLLVLLVAISISIVGISVYLNQSDENVLSVELPPLDFADFNSGNTNTNGAIFAKIKQTSYAVDLNANVVKAVQSKGIQGNPSLDFVDPESGKQLAGIVVIPKVWFDYTSAFKPQLTLDPSTLQLRILSTGPDGTTKITTVIKNLNTQTLNFNAGDAELSLGSFGITKYEIENDLPAGNYDSIQEIWVYGDLKLHYTDYPTIKMTIPIGKHDIKSYYTARIASETAPLDTDGDGIPDTADSCDEDRENYNGYQDTDGCPDSPPVQEPTSEPAPGPTEPTDAEKCINAGDTWTNGVCVDSDSSSSTTINSVNAFAVIGVETNYLDGTKVSRAFTSNSDGKFDFVLNDLIGFHGGSEKSIGSTVYTTYIGSFTDSLKGLKIKSSDLKYTGSINIASKDITVGTKIGAGGSTSEAKLLTLPELDTTVTFNGIAVSQATFTSVDIHNAIKNYNTIELVPEGSERNLDFIVSISGPITLTTSSPSTATVTGNLVGASASFNGLKLSNKVIPKTGDTGVYNSFGEAEKACGGASNVKSIGGGQYQCVGGSSGNVSGGIECQDDQYVVVIDGIETCMKKGGTVNNPNPSVPGGDDVCIDADNPGGFPCTDAYKSLWCNNTTNCEVPPKSTGDPGNNLGSINGDNDGDNCTDSVGFQSNSIADGVCVNGDDSGGNQNGDPGDFCTSAQNCIEKQFNIDLNDPLTLGVIAIGGLVLLTSVLKRDSKYSPIPASSTQFSR